MKIFGSPATASGTPQSYPKKGEQPIRYQSSFSFGCEIKKTVAHSLASSSFFVYNGLIPIHYAALLLRVLMQHLFNRFNKSIASTKQLMRTTALCLRG